MVCCWDISDHGTYNWRYIIPKAQVKSQAEKKLFNANIISWIKVIKEPKELYKEHYRLSGGFSPVI